MEAFKYIVLSILMIISLNSIIIDFIDKKTKFKPKDIENNIWDTKYRLLFIFLGPFCFLFLKRIRRWRKTYYYKKRLQNIENLKKWGLSPYSDDFCKDEINQMNRYLKLQKLK